MNFEEFKAAEPIVGQSVFVSVMGTSSPSINKRVTGVSKPFSFESVITSVDDRMFAVKGLTGVVFNNKTKRCCNLYIEATLYPSQDAYDQQNYRKGLIAAIEGLVRGGGLLELEVSQLETMILAANPNHLLELKKG